MKCPLFGEKYRNWRGKISWETRDCQGPKCAWWDADNEQCALLTLSGGIWLVNQELLRLIEKMPHVEQFVK